MKHRALKGICILAIGFIAIIGAYAASGDGEIKIGVLGPTTGTMAIGGSHQKDGVQFAIDEINAAGGLLGRQLKAIYEDTEGNAQNAVTIMNKFLYRDNVSLTIGSNNSPEILAVLDLIAKAKTPHIVPSGVAAGITASGNEWIFRITATDGTYSRALVEYAVKSLKSSKIAIIYDTNDYGQGGKRMVEENLKNNGLGFVMSEGYTTGTKDFAPLLMKAKSSGADSLIIWGNYTEGAQLVRQIRDLNLTCNVLVSTGVTIGNFFQLAGDAANGIYGVSSGFSPQRTDKVAVDFMNKFKEKKGYVPDINVVLAYDAMIVYAQAVKNAGSADKQAVRDALRKIQNYPVVSGSISFKANGEGGTSYTVFKIENGTQKLIQ
jgi:branched-chain amino acid transport system substrate-binding protein